MFLPQTMSKTTRSRSFFQFLTARSLSAKSSRRRFSYSSTFLMKSKSLLCLAYSSRVQQPRFFSSLSAYPLIHLSRRPSESNLRAGLCSTIARACSTFSSEFWSLPAYLSICNIIFRFKVYRMPLGFYLYKSMFLTWLCLCKSLNCRSNANAFS